jgi:chromosome partitioning protein
MRRIVIASQKGGVGKTTTAVCLAVGLARRGVKTLLIDGDGQGSATWTLTHGAAIDGPTLADVLLRNALADEAIVSTSTAGLDLLPADATLNGAAVALVQELGRDARLRSAMASVGDRWDVAIVDTAPAFSTILANALVFGSEVIVPVEASTYSMLGLVDLQRTIGEVKEAYGNESLHLAGLLITRVQRNNVARDIEAGLRERFGPLVFQATIPMSSKVEESVSNGQTVLDYAPKSPAALAYDLLVTEILDRGTTKGRGGKAGVRGSRKTGDAA